MGKYVEAQEIADYYRQGSSVIYYQHKARKQDDEYAMQFHNLLTAIDIPQARGLGLKFISTSQRFYFFVIQPRHESIIRDCVAQMLTTEWSKHFCLVEPNEAGDTIPQRREISMNETKKAVISVLGTDKKGIIAQVSRILYENDANILDITQTIVSGLFSMILIADVSTSEGVFDTLKTELDALGERIGVQIRTQRSEIFEAMHQI
jgi:ACT domain-containing protein